MIPFYSKFIRFAVIIGITASMLFVWGNTVHSASLREELIKNESLLAKETDPSIRRPVLEEAGWLHFLLDEYVASEHAFEEAMNIEPLSAPKYVSACASVFEHMNEPDAADSLLLEDGPRFSGHPDYSDILFTQSNIYKDRKQYDLQRVILNKISEVEDGSAVRAKALMDMSLSYRSSGNLQDAMTALVDAHEQAGSDFEIWRRIQLSKLILYWDLGDTAGFEDISDLIGEKLKEREDVLLCSSYSAILRIANHPKYQFYRDLAIDAVQKELSNNPTEESLTVGRSLVRAVDNKRAWLDELINITDSQPQFDLHRQRLLLRRGLRSDLEEIIDKYPKSVYALVALNRLAFAALSDKDAELLRNYASTLRTIGSGYQYILAQSYYFDALAENLSGNRTTAKTYISSADEILKTAKAVVIFGFPGKRTVKFNLRILEANIAEAERRYKDAKDIYLTLLKEHAGPKSLVKKKLKKVERLLR